ncbi:MAG: polysaccharide biosynthesis C-terminal domain-containing protein [Clostridia bacterium]|nr:polysaccharide biosynthesis C-terminal domain-containing protein [Clostridia bacterium]
MAQQNTGGRGKLLAINTTALTVGRLGSKLLVFLLVRFYTFVLTKEEFGTADLITSLCNFLIPIACAGLSSGFFRFAAEARSKQEQCDVFSSGMSILALASMGFALLSPILFFIPYFSEYVWLILLYVLCANFHYLCSDFIRAQGNYRLFALQGLLNTALNIGFNLLFLLPLSMGLIGYVLSIIAADLTTSLLLFFYCKLWHYLRPGAASRATVRAMLRYSVPLIPAALCWWITSVSDRFMVTYFCGEAQNGLYAAAYKIPNILTTACGIFIDAWQFSAVLANRKATDTETTQEADERRRSLTVFFTKIFRNYGAFLWLAAGGLILLTKPMAALLFDASFADAWQYIPVLLLATALSALSNFVGSVYMVECRGVATMLTSLIGALVNIGLNLWLIPLMGPMGAAIATLISYLLVFLIRLIHTRRFIPFRVPLVWLLLNSMILGALCTVMTLAVHGWIWYSLGACLLLAIIDAPYLLRSIIQLLRQRRQKT